MYLSYDSSFSSFSNLYEVDIQVCTQTETVTKDWQNVPLTSTKLGRMTLSRHRGCQRRWQGQHSESNAALLLGFLPLTSFGRLKSRLHVMSWLIVWTSAVVGILAFEKVKEIHVLITSRILCKTYIWLFWVESHVSHIFIYYARLVIPMMDLI